jgi:AraC-like DNA-binding protein
MARYLDGVDVLTSVLATTQVHGAILADFRHFVPFGLEMTKGDVAGFHYVLSGSCVLLAPRRAPMPLLQGDLVLVPGGSRHAIADDVDSPLEPIEDFLARGPRPSKAEHAPRVVCGAFRWACGGPHPLMRLLPPFLRVPQSAVARSRALSSTLALLTIELDEKGPGTSGLVDRLMDVLFVYVVRTWLAEQPDGAAGWLGALRDRQMGMALAAIHEQPERRWTNASLASLVGLSRASFARRFTSLVGVPPLAYLTQWRLSLAARRLQTSDESLARIAADVGYESEFAFSRAFKRAHGAPPSHYRAAERRG